MQFAILGSLEVRDRGVGVAIRGRRQRALLAMLLLRRNTVVSVDDLIDGIWEQPPANAHASLLNQIGRLRLTLGRDVLETVQPGYRFRTRAREVDLDRYLALVESKPDADAPTRSTLLRRADLLWRGPALGDVLLFGSSAEEVEALNELRLDVIEQRVEAELAAGLHLELASELGALVAKYPRRERFAEQQMIALYRAGRQTDALEVYRAARRRLVEEFGLDPGVALARIERAILAHDLPFSLNTQRTAPPSVLARTVELAPGTYAEKADFAYRLGMALILMGEREHGLTALEESYDRAVLAGVRVTALRAQLQLDVHRLYRERRPLTEARDVTAQTAAESLALDDDLGAAVALGASALARRALGDVAGAVEDLRRAGAHSRRATGTSWPTGYILANEAESLFIGPFPVSEATTRCEEILDAVPWGPPGPWGVYCSLAMLKAMRGEFGAARAFVRRAATACEEYGIAVLRAGWVSRWEAGVEELAGETEAAEVILREARADPALADAPVFARDLAPLHARLLALLDRASDASAAIEDFEPWNPGDVEGQANFLRARALTLSSAGQTSAGVDSGLQALEALDGTDLLALQGETLLDLARLHAAADAPDAALACANDARALFARKGHSVGIQWVCRIRQQFESSARE
jgi:DNA-binding SARP family transcriptional activator